MSYPEQTPAAFPLPGPSQLTIDQLNQIRAYFTQDPLPTPVSQLTGYQHVVSGSLDGTGGILSSSPANTFTVNHTGTGKFTVTFDPPYQNPPAVVTCGNSLGNARFVIAGNITGSGFDVEVYNPGGAAANDPWSFFAQGR